MDKGARQDENERQIESSAPEVSLVQAPVHALTAGQLVGSYRIISLLGEGGMGSVYKVEQIFLKKEYALKTLGGGRMSSVVWLRFRKEAQAAALLDHPALIKVVDFGLVNEEQPFFVMDFVQGETLSNLIKRGALPLNMVLEIFDQAASGLGYAHSQGVIHRDIKPSNIMVTNAQNLSELKVKIVDFGIAKVLTKEDAEALTLTKTGEVFGTPYYMSPEQCLGIAIDQSSDIYSLGCVMFEALTGSPPFLSETALTIMMKHQSERQPTLREATLGKIFPSAIEQVVAKMLEKEPRNRYANLFDVASDLKRIRAGEPIELGAGSPQSVQRLHSPSNAIVASYLLTAAIFLGFAAFMAGRLTAPHSVAVKAARSADPEEVASALIRTSDTVMSNSTIDGSCGKPFSSTLPLHPKTRYFHFPSESLGVLTHLDCESEVYVFKNGEFDKIKEAARADAKGEVVIENWHPCGLIANQWLCQHPQWFDRFRPDELVEADFSKTWIAADDDLEQIARLKTVKALDITDNKNVTDAAVKSINQLPALTDLRMTRAGLTARAIAKLHRLKQLHKLDIGSITGIAPVLANMQGSTEISSLKVRLCQIDGKDMERICTMSNLKRLDIAGNTKLTDSDLEHIATLKGLCALSIDGCSHLTASCFKSLQTLPLRDLTLTVEQFPPQALSRLGKALPYCHLHHPGLDSIHLLQKELPTKILSD